MRIAHILLRHAHRLSHRRIEYPPTLPVSDLPPLPHVLPHPRFLFRWRQKAACDNQAVAA